MDGYQDTPTPDDELPPPIPGLHEGVSAFQQALPEGSVAKAWGETVSDTIQGFLNQKNIVDTAVAAGHKFVSDIDGFKSQLVGMAHDDPSTTPLALALVPPSISAIVGATGADPTGEHANTLAQHIQSEIARAGVQSYAIQDGDLARQALDDHGQHLTEQDRTSLSGFITTMEAARAGDSAAQVGETARRVALSSDLLGHSWLTGLADPNGDVQMPNNWLRDMVADPRVDPKTKAALWMAHDNLREGDVASSDPSVVSNMIMRLAGESGPRPTLAEVVSHAGDDLTLADAAHLAAATFPRTPSERAYLGQVAQTLQSARGIIAAPENGIAGQVAFGRFTDWFMGEARAGAIMDPRSDDWLLADPRAISKFMPTIGDALVDRAPPATADRPSLADIFGRPSRSASAAFVSAFGAIGDQPDQVVRTAPLPPVSMPPVDVSNSPAVLRSQGLGKFDADAPLASGDTVR